VCVCKKRSDSRSTAWRSFQELNNCSVFDQTVVGRRHVSFVLFSLRRLCIAFSRLTFFLTARTWLCFGFGECSFLPQMAPFSAQASDDGQQDRQEQWQVNGVLVFVGEVQHGHHVRRKERICGVLIGIWHVSYRSLPSAALWAYCTAFNAAWYWPRAQLVVLLSNCHNAAWTSSNRESGTGMLTSSWISDENVFKVCWAVQKWATDRHGHLRTYSDEDCLRWPCERQRLIPTQRHRDGRQAKWWQSFVWVSQCPVEISIETRMPAR